MGYILTLPLKMAQIDQRRSNIIQGYIQDTREALGEDENRNFQWRRGVEMNPYNTLSLMKW